jgi:2,4-dienoyl-CoA reductase-like NADH-dependent reductase (Old Yellow Enzyme family)
MSVLFEATEINGMTLSNRFVRSATWEGLASPDGSCTSKLVSFMETLAQGGLGLIISGHTYIRPDGQVTPWQLGVYKDEQVEGLKAMTEAVHRHGGRIVLQLSHGGFFAHTRLIKQAPFAPSGTVEVFGKLPRKEMTPQDIETFVEAFRKGAGRAKLAGFDGVQIHAAHGYLLNQFLSPAFNHRQDQYGGNIRGRAKFLVDVLYKIRDEVGADYPILVKINSEDFLEGGLTVKDSVDAALILRDAGADAVEVTGGTTVSGDMEPSRKAIDLIEQEAYFRHAARIIRDKTRMPVMLVGGIRSFDLAERLVLEGWTDYISMARPLIREPGLVNRWKAGDLRRAECRSVNKCFRPGLKGKGIYCLVDRKAKK